MAELIKRCGPPRLDDVRGHTFIWSVPISGEPSGLWMDVFRSPREYTSVCSPSPNRVTISPRDRLLIFEILEDEETGVPTWIRRIDKWIEDANAAVLLHEEKMQRAVEEETQKDNERHE